MERIATSEDWSGVKLLLDTHVWFWMLNEPERLGPQCRTKLLNEGNGLFVSVVTSLELARLADQGRLDVGKDLMQWMDEGLSACDANEIELDRRSAIEAYRLPSPLHKDPADRLLIAQARLQDMVLVTMDDAILDYRHVRSLDARR